MGKISAFLFTSLNGFYKGNDEDISWHNHGEEELFFSEASLSKGDSLLFGRVTYEHMEAFWPTAEAKSLMPKVAQGMGASEKLVISRTRKEADWENTIFLGEDWLSRLAEIKQSKNITLLGSGAILTQLAEADLLDELQLMLDAKVIGQGTSIFHSIRKSINLELKEQQIFKTGNILLTYSILKNSL